MELRLGWRGASGQMWSPEPLLTGFLWKHCAGWRSCMGRSRTFSPPLARVLRRALMVAPIWAAQTAQPCHQEGPPARSYIFRKKLPRHGLQHQHSSLSAPALPHVAQACSQRAAAHAATAASPIQPMKGATIRTRLATLVRARCGLLVQMKLPRPLGEAEARP